MIWKIWLWPAPPAITTNPTIYWPFDEEGVAGRPLFKPRKDRWHEHFEFDSGTLSLKGKTAQGKGTINRLRTNHAVQIEERRLWVELGSR